MTKMFTPGPLVKMDHLKELLKHQIAWLVVRRPPLKANNVMMMWPLQGSHFDCDDSQIHSALFTFSSLYSEMVMLKKGNLLLILCPSWLLGRGPSHSSQSPPGCHIRGTSCSSSAPSGCQRRGPSHSSRAPQDAVKEECLMICSKLKKGE